MFLGHQDPNPDPSFSEIKLAKQDFNTKFSLHSEEKFQVISHEHRAGAREYRGQAVLGIRIRRFRIFLGLQDPNPDPLVRDPDPSFS
jgi:hypothetical protein